MLHRKLAGRFFLANAPWTLIRRGVWMGSVIALSAGTFSANSQADNLTLKNGGRIDGKTIATPDPNSVVVRTDENVLMQIANAQISRTIKSSTREATYVEKLKKTPDTAEAQRELAKDCRANDLNGLSKAHYERLTELAPGDSDGWLSLRYVEVPKTGERMTEALYFKRLGLVNYDGHPTTSHAAELTKARKKIREDENALRREIESAFRNLDKPGSTGLNAKQYLLNLSDPRATPVLAKKLLEEVSAGRNANYILDILFQMPKGSATKEFIAIARKIDVPDIVDPILEELASTESTRTIAMLAFLSDLKTPLGKKPDIAMIDRAGRNLSTLADERIIPRLIDRLITKVMETQVIQGGTTMTSGGGIASSTGGSRQVQKTLTHASVLATLGAITGKSFSYNQDEWRRWYAMTYAHENIDTRRFE